MRVFEKLADLKPLVGQELAVSDWFPVSQQRIDQFNAMFTDAKKGDVIVLDYIPNQGTKVTIAGTEKGVIPGKDFNDAMLLIWLGDKPVTKDLRAKLLGAGK